MDTTVISGSPALTVTPPTATATNVASSTPANPNPKQPASPISGPAVKKTLDVTDPESAKSKILDIVTFGDPNAWLLLAKASSEREGWMKSTKVLPIDGVGCLVQISTQQRNHDGTHALAEALQFLPGVKLIEERDASGNVLGRKLRHL
jgi:hypothetical protein